MHTLILPWKAYMKFCVTTLIRRLLIVVLFVSTASILKSQADLVSPYSLFGIGLINPRISSWQSGMGGAGVASFDPYRLNLSNMATLAYQLDPVFETSGKGSISTFESPEGSYDNRGFILNNLTLSAPLQRGKWGVALGLVPYSVSGYDVLSRGSDTGLDSEPVTVYSGDGGINQGFLGTGVRLLNKVDTAGNVSSLAIGGSFNFNFGTIDSGRRLFFPDDNTSFGFRSNESVLVRDYNFDLGVHYHFNLIKRTLKSPRYLKLLVGVSGSTGQDLNARRTVYSFNFLGQSGASPIDTIAFEDRVKGSIRLPARLTGGFTFDYVGALKARIRFSVDYSIQWWSNYSTNFSDQALASPLVDSKRVGAGVEYTPRVGSTTYFELVEYRAGFFYEQSNLELRDQNIDNVGMSFGLTLPIHTRRAITRSAFHIAGQLGTSGTTDSGLIEENYFRMFVGFSFTPHIRNRWFVQQKYD